MSLRTGSVVLLSLLAACAAPRSAGEATFPLSTFNRESSKRESSRAPDPIGGASDGVTGARAKPGSLAAPSNFRAQPPNNPGPQDPTAPAPQEQDYSLRAMFLNAHGDFLQAANRDRPNIKFTYRYQAETETNNDPGDFYWNEFDVDAMFSIPVDRDWAILLGGESNIRAYNFSSSIVGPDGDETLYHVGMTGGVRWFIQDDLDVMVTITPGVYTDWDGSLNSRDWYVDGLAIATYKYQDDFFFKGGLRVSDAIDDMPWLPLLGFVYLPDKDWRIDVLIPKEATVSYLMDNNTTLTVGLELDGAEYNVRSEPGTGKVEKHWLVQELRMFVEADYRFTENINAFARFGGLLYGHYELRGVVDDNDGHVSPAVYFDVGVGWKF